MKIIAGRNFEGLAHAADTFIKSTGLDLQDATRDMTLHIGAANDPEFRTPAHARDCLYVGDGAHFGQLIASPELRTKYSLNPASVAMHAHWNSQTGKWDMVAREVPKFVGDAAFDTISGQAIAPWSQGFFTEMFEKPLLYSHASDLVKMESGTLPWCEVMNLMLADFGGAAFGLNNGGSGDNNFTKDVTVTSGIMSSLVMNMFVTYSLTVEEQEAAKSAGGNPFGARMIQMKIQYANYVLQMLTDFLTYYGNADTGTQGLMQVNAIAANPNNSIAQVLAGNSQTKGSDLYKILSGFINDFFTKSYNKFDHIKVAMSTYAYNQLCSISYSDQFEAKSVKAIFDENYNGGAPYGKEGSTPRIEFFADPLLDANTEFNATNNDYLVITAPTVGQGAEDTKKPIILQGMPLKEFVYPVVPGHINTQHRVLRRYAGVYAPLKDSVKVYSGFGKKA